jgi:large subunit ribosomal protein L23
MSMSMLLKPRVSEKAYGQSETKNVYVFEVPSDAGKLEIATAVSAQFAVHVLNVNLMNVKGKVKRTVRRGGRPTTGKRPDFKKAYVTVKAGDSIPLFPEDDATKSTKEAEKASERTSKTLGRRRKTTKEKK